MVKKNNNKKRFRKNLFDKKEYIKKRFFKTIRATKTKIFKPYISLYGKKFILYD